MVSLKEVIILDEILERREEEKRHGNTAYNQETGLSYVSVNVWDIEVSRNLEQQIWKMSDFYGVISTWCEIQSKCRLTSIQFVV